MKAELPNHEPSLMLMNCGDSILSRPSVGSWVTYGLGSDNKNLPSFVSMSPGGYPIKGAQNWQSGFLPGVYQATFIDSNHSQVDKLIENIKPLGQRLESQREQLNFLNFLNSNHLKSRSDDKLLNARIQNFELAYRMQMDATDAFDLEKEPKYLRDLYGGHVHGRQTLIARRLLERESDTFSYGMEPVNHGITMIISKKTTQNWLLSWILQLRHFFKI